MNKYDAKEYLPLVQALADGKTIQYNMNTTERPCWEDMQEISLDGLIDDYRIKLEPREWVLYRPAGCSDLIAYAQPVSSFRDGIRVREILD